MTLLFSIMTLLYHLFFCKCPDYYFSLFHYLQKDYISLMTLLLFHLFYPHLLLLLWLLSHYYLHYFIWDYYYYHRFQVLLFFIIFFLQNIISIIAIVAIEIMAIIAIIDIIVIIYCWSPAHKSGIWLQILGLTAGMHSYTSGASISAKILRNPVGRCTSVLADTPLKQAFSTVFDPPQQHDRDTTEPHIQPNV